MATDILPTIDNQEEIEKPDYSVDEDIKAPLKALIQALTTEDNAIRQTQLREWRRNEAYFKGRQRGLFYSDYYNDWVLPTIEEAEITGQDLESLGKVVNDTKAHGESLIAAMTAAIPSTRYFPEDADDPNDIATAEGYSKIGEMIRIRNRAKSLLTRSTYLLYIESFAAAYNYHRYSFEYGKSSIPKIEMLSKSREESYCPECGMNIGMDGMNAEAPANIQDIQDTQVPSTQETQEPKTASCTQCMREVIPERITLEDVYPTKVGDIDSPRGREIIEIYGSRQVKVPINIRTLEEAAYLRLETEQHYSRMIEIYPELRDKIRPSSSADTYEKHSRTPIEPLQTIDVNYLTVSQTWLQPWTYNVLEESDAKLIRKQYPTGVRVVMIEDEVAECIEEKLLEHWTITEDPTSTHIHTDPMVKTFIPIQDMKNDLVNLILDTIKHGIPITFFDPFSLDADGYRENRAMPGDLYPAKAKPGQNLAGSFETLKPATMSQEYNIFLEAIERFGQFGLGDFPSIFGGVMEGGSDTLGEYQQSRVQALQRLLLKWGMLAEFWQKVEEKAVRSTAKHMIEDGVDEKFTRGVGKSSKNVWIKVSELEGKVGRVIAENSDQFPTTWPQKRGVIMQLMGMKNPPTDAALYHAENTEFVAALLGLSDMYIPGREDREKQLLETQELIRGEPIMGPMGPEPSVPIEPDVDDDAIHAQVCKSFLNSLEGMALKKENPGAYQNVVLHMMGHVMRLAPPMPEEEMAPGEPANPNAIPEVGPPAVESPMGGME